MNPIIDTVRATLDRFEMLSGGPVLVMVSGGGDSVALLRLFASGALGEDLDLHVLHVDHQMRGVDSEEDARFVAELCEHLGVPCSVEATHVAGLAERVGLNLEDAGRRERYRLADEHLDRICTERGVSASMGRIAVAHSFDDRMETFLMRLAQGAGATGLTTLRPVRGRVVRPLIETRRADIRAYLDEIVQPWHEDLTNADTNRLRAKVRHDVVSLFEEINPRFADALTRTLDVLTAEDDLLREMGEAFARDFVERVGDELRLNLEMMRTLTRAMQRRTVRAAIGDAFPEASRLEFEHIEAILDGIEDPGFARDLSWGLRAHSEYGTIIISRAGEGPSALAPSLLPIPGIVDLGLAGRLVAEFSSVDDTSGDPDSVVIDMDAVRGDLSVGSVREGDRMRPLGMTGTKKLSDLLIDSKVPRRGRTQVPVIRDDDRIVWLAGVRMAEEYRVTPATTRAVRLRWERNG